MRIHSATQTVRIFASGIYTIDDTVAKELRVRRDQPHEGRGTGEYDLMPAGCHGERDGKNAAG